MAKESIRPKTKTNTETFFKPRKSRVLTEAADMVTQRSRIGRVSRGVKTPTLPFPFVAEALKADFRVTASADEKLPKKKRKSPISHNKQGRLTAKAWVFCMPVKKRKKRKRETPKKKSPKSSPLKGNCPKRSHLDRDA